MKNSSVSRKKRSLNKTKMNRNYFTFVIYIIFSVVEFSTSYDNPNIHHYHSKLKRELKSQHDTHQGKHHHSNFRDNNNETTTLPPTSPPTTGISSLKVFVNTSADTIGFYNSPQSAAVFFNYSANRLVFLNGENGTGIFIDLLSESIGQINSSLWQSSKESLESFLKSHLSSFGSLITNSVSNQTQNLTNPSEEILQQISTIASNLGFVSNNSTNDPSQILQRISKIARTLSSRSGFLIPLINPLNNRELSIPARNGIERFARIVEALARLFTIGPTLFARLVSSGMEIDLSEILNSSNGLEAFVKLIQQIIKHSPLGQTCGPALNNITGFLGILDQLSKGNNSADNSLNFLHNLVSAINGQNSSVLDLIRHLITSNQTGGFASDFQPQLNQLLNLTSQNGSNSQQLEGFIGILRGLLSNNLLYRGTNLSKILDLLRRGDFVRVFDNLLRIFIQLNKLYNPFVAIPLFIGKIIFGGSNGWANGFEPIIKQIESGGLNLTHIIQSGGLSNLTQLLPFLGNSGGGDIISHFLSGLNGGQFNLESIFKPLSGLNLPPGILGPGPVVPSSSGDNNSSTTTEAQNLTRLVSELIPKVKHFNHKRAHHSSDAHHKDENYVRHH